jgi:orotidine-5'-phosphate decarboxylase
MGYVENLRQRAEQAQSIVCMGIDPVMDKIPLRGKTEDVLFKFYREILHAMEAEKTYPAIVKPNIAFFEQYGFEGLRALKNIIEEYKKKNIPVLLDAKRGDIGKTSTAYANAVFGFWKADAVTINPYMGSDSVMPFIDWCAKGKGVYVLARTSNKGASDLQSLIASGNPLYLKVAEKISEWHQNGVGAVVGATSINELKIISKFFVHSGKEIPMLIPGVGAQGGSAREVIAALKETGNDISLHRINSSSGINFAYETYKTDDFAGAAVKALKELNAEIGYGT